MARKKPPQIESVFSFWREMILRSVPIVAAIAMAGTAFYFTTNSRIETHEVELKRLQLGQETLSSKIDAADHVTNADRQKLRDDIASRAERTAEGISILTKDVAVMNTQLATVNGTLDKISRQLEAKPR